MFEAAVHKFVKEAGPDILHYVPSLDEANRCRCLQIVEKKKRRWFWQSARYRPTDFIITDILVDEKPLAVPIQSRVLVKDCKRTHKFTLKGKFGGALKVLFDAELAGGDTVNVTSKFGNILKKEVPQNDLAKALHNRKINLKNDLVQQALLMKKRKVLCIITGSAEIEDDAVISASTDENVDESVDINLPKVVKKIVNVDESVDETTDDTKSLNIPKGTPLAYNICEMKITTDGGITLMVDEDSTGGFVEYSTDTVDAPLASPETYDMFKMIMDMNNEDRHAITQAVLQLCQSPSDVENLLLLFKNAYRARRDGKPMKCSIEVVGSMFVDDSETSWKPILRRVGFFFKPDSLIYPVAMDSLMSSICTLLEALEELDDDTLAALTQLNKDGSGFAEPLYRLLKACSTSRNAVPLPGSKPVGLNTANFLKQLGCSITEDSVTASEADRKEIEGAFRVIFALFCDKSVT